MNNIKSTSRINQKELELALTPGASWHEEFKDSAYIYVGGLPTALTEGDVITIFSQYGEILDISLPRHRAPQPGKEQNQANSSTPAPKPGTRRGFGFLLYEDQRSTVLAVDNLNDTTILDRKIRVEHVKDFEQIEKDKDNKGKFKERDEMRFNARPELQEAGPSNSNQVASSRSQATVAGDLDLEDPMASYLSKKDKEKSSSYSKEKEEKRRRKEERARIREERRLRKDGKKRKESVVSSDEDGDGGVNRFEEMKKRRRLEEEDRKSRESEKKDGREKDHGRRSERDSREREFGRDRDYGRNRDHRGDDYREKDYRNEANSRARSHESRDSRGRFKETGRSPRGERDGGNDRRR